MLNNLEDISKNDVISFDGASYKEFRQSLVPNYFVVWRDILTGYFFIIALILLTGYVGKRYLNYFFIIIPLAAALIGYFFAYVELFLHEAAHYNIHPDRNMNDLLANIFLGIWVGTKIDSYRKIHWEHHRSLGTTHDTENSYFNGLTPVFIIKNLFGIHVISILLQRRKKLKDMTENATTEQTNSNDKWFFLAGMLLNLSVAIVAFLLGYWQLSLAWMGAVFAFYPLYAALRQLLEHRSEKASLKVNYFEVDHGKLTRIFKPGVFSHFFGGAGFDRHMLHHWEPQISYTRLREMEHFLRTTPQCKDVIEQSRTTYFNVFARLIRFSLTV